MNVNKVIPVAQEIVCISVVSVDASPLRESVQADDDVNEELTACNRLHCTAYERWYYSVGSVILFIWLLVIFVKK